ncbi:Uncharacterised protein [Nocardia farcinica]|uniref:effector-associated constant component EACC1 n=1 Tax=Nocardia farcinica TaxID=37329 RepID=UPI000A38EA5D|nr:hypothetical protein [Nocardia farcinica]SUE28943.1 Uncharacterised protein [Nocardia farcinica]
MPNSDGQLLIHTNGGPDTAAQLLDWMRDDDGLRGRVRLQDRPIREGDMGAISDTVTVALGSGVTVGVVTALARSLTTWLTHRRSDITVTVTRSNGDTIEFTGDRVDSDEVLRQIRNLVAPADGTHDQSAS